MLLQGHESDWTKACRCICVQETLHNKTLEYSTVIGEPLHTLNVSLLRGEAKSYISTWTINISVAIKDIIIGSHKTPIAD